MKFIMPDEEEAWLLAERLEWYASSSVPPNMPELGYEERDEDGSITGTFGRPAQEMYDLIYGRDDPKAQRLVRYARRMRTPKEEADRLVSTGKFEDHDDLLREPVPEEGSKAAPPDPYGGYRRRLQDWNDWMVGKHAR